MSDASYRKTPYKDWPEERKARARNTNRKWVSENREKALAARRKREAVYRQDPAKLALKREKDLVAYRKYRNTEKWQRTFRRAHLKRKYGITPEQYDLMFTQQRGLCAICTQPETNKRNKLLCVDHNHATQELRGLLCNDCNKAIGIMQDSQARLQSAIEYLNRYSKGRDSNF